MQYFFVLGRNRELSLAELYATLPKAWKPLILAPQILVAQCSELPIPELMSKLGGTIKIGRLVAHCKPPFTSSALISQLSQHTKEKKLFLGLSAYQADNSATLPTVRELRQLGMQTKRELEEQGYRVRLVTSQEIALSSVIVKQEKLLRQGVELVLLYGKNEILLGKTLAVQEFSAASARDFGRPQREMRVGMLPIQLAKILINLARVSKGGVVLDSFCGLGTVLAEAALMGYQNLIGTDIEPAMVEATRKNLDWLFSNSRELENKPSVQLLASPVEKLSTKLPPRSVDAIVTEPYLGPTRGIGNYESGIMNELTKLYTDAFREFTKILKPGGRVVFILPAFRHGTQLIKTSTNILPQIKKLGFNPIQLLPQNLSTPYTLPTTYSIIYSRPDQKVLREIFMFEYQS